MIENIFRNHNNDGDDDGQIRGLTPSERKAFQKKAFELSPGRINHCCFQPKIIHAADEAITAPIRGDESIYMVVSTYHFPACNIFLQ